MANQQPRSSRIFSGLVLVSVGALLLLHNYRGLDLGEVFTHWWPLLFIFWGLIKLYERTAGRKFAAPGSARITTGEILLVFGMLALVGIVVAVDYGKQKLGDALLDTRESYDYPIDVAPRSVPANAHLTIRTGRGDIHVRSADALEIRASAKATVRSWSEDDAKRVAAPISVEIVQNGDAYEVHPAGYDLGDSRVSVDLEIAVPQKAALVVKTDKGDVTVSDMGNDVSVLEKNGDVEVRDTTGDVSIETNKGDAKVSDTKGNIKISGKGGQIEAVNATGSLTIDGDFYGPVRADKVAKGVRLISMKTDLTLTQLTGHMEAASGNLEVVDAPGNLTVRTRDNDVSIENAGGKVKLDNRNGNVEVRFAAPPKDDVEITNSSSGITLSLPGSSIFEIQADCQSCDIESEFSADSLKVTKSESGNSHLEGKYGSGRGPKISLKTSYGPITIRKTT